ncbi:hypothetical protein C8A00DRAFT_47511 [Chaetomidium leptoderma]|uniref:Uncharacterized protein n=1 Tax=Chaetomidium leptoderma TaxID=669021 RepID=A0AAN6VC58_9PEZI|nr:hypothetical protein C8A00DRAFT_47511 [Chaetomidium leptoderma]
MAPVAASFGTLPTLDQVPDALTSYDPRAYDSLPSLGSAFEKFQQSNALTTVMGPIRDLFLRYNVNKDLGIALLHKHFPILPKHRLVDSRNMSAPWDMSHGTNAIAHKYDGVVWPRSFRLNERLFVPYEFGFSDAEFPSLRNQDFLVELSLLLHERKLDKVLGIRVLDQHNSDLPVEVTEGNVNMMIRRGTVPDEELIPAPWVFGYEDEACHCKEFCRVDKGNHVEKNHSCG